MQGGSNATNRQSASVKRTDSLTKSEKTENNLKEKSEKRCREIKRSETNEGLEEKKPKGMRHSGEYLRQVNSNENVKNDQQQPGLKLRRLSTDVRHRRHNVKELKEKFEPTTPDDTNTSLTNNKNNGNNRRSGNRRSRSNIKRRHTVGGTKDLGKVIAWQKALLQWPNLPGEHQKAFLLHHQMKPSNLTSEVLEQLLSFNSWEARERLGASSPDIPHLLELLLPGGQEEQQHRRLSVREPWMLQPVLESHV